MAVRREWTIGAHQARFEEPDVLWVKYNHRLVLEDARRAVDMYREASTLSPFFLLADITGANLDNDARKLLVDAARPEWFKGIVYVGATPVMKAVAKAMTVAFYFTGKWKVDFEWADTEAQGRAWIDRAREKQAARKS